MDVHMYLLTLLTPILIAFPFLLISENEAVLQSANSLLCPQSSYCCGR